MNLSHWPDEELKKKEGIRALQGPGSGGRLQGSMEGRGKPFNQHLLTGVDIVPQLGAYIQGYLFCTGYGLSI